jgi:predicted metal-dependent phosphoesterase TrpH
MHWTPLCVTNINIVKKTRDLLQTTAKIISKRRKKVIIGHILKKVRQYNGQRKNDKKTNNDLQNTTKKSKLKTLVKKSPTKPKT